MARRAIGLLFAAFGCIAHATPASTSCATSLGGLRELLADPAMPLRWREVTMTDGRPLVLTILERDGVLVLEFVKSGEGLWAESGFVVCRRGALLVARANAAQVRLGPAAGWLTRLAFANGGAFRLARQGADRLRIETTAWGGTFAPEAPAVSLPPAGNLTVTIPP